MSLPADKKAATASTNILPAAEWRSKKTPKSAFRFFQCPSHPFQLTESANR
jgi:hypothetical protein